MVKDAMRYKGKLTFHRLRSLHNHINSKIYTKIIKFQLKVISICYRLNYVLPKFIC